MLDAARVEWDAEGRYLPIPRYDSQAGYHDMEAFIEILDDQHDRERLEVAIRGRGAFRRFRDVLDRYPETEAHWFQFRDAREHNRLMDWLASEDIEPEFE